MGGIDRVRLHCLVRGDRALWPEREVPDSAAEQIRRSASEMTPLGNSGKRRGLGPLNGGCSDYIENAR